MKVSSWVMGARAGALGAVAGLALAATSAQAQVELNFWDQPWGPAEYSATAQKLVDEFNASQSEIKVNYRAVPWTDWYTTYSTAIASNSAPDLSTGAGFMGVQFYSMDAIHPVDELVAKYKADGTDKDFLEGSIEGLKYDGHYVGLPWQIDIRMIYYNKDLLAAKGIAVPTTWDEFRAAAKAATGDGTYGLVVGSNNNVVHWILTSTINNGGGLFDADGKPALDTGRAREALDFLGALVADGSVNPASAGYSDDDARGSFFAGKSAFYLDPPGATARAGDAAGMVGILPPLTGPHGDKGTIFWVNNVMVYKQTQHPKETLAFLEWWSANQKPLWTEGKGGGFPARSSILADPHFAQDADISFAIQNYVPVAKPMSAPVGGTFPQLNAIDGDGFLKSFGQKILQGVPVADAVPEAQAHLVELMAQ